MTTGERIKIRREELGLSAKTIASDLGVSVATVYRYERGDISKIPSDILRSLASILETTQDNLMGWEIDDGIVHNVFDVSKEIKKPLLGNIACGEPILAEENVSEYVEVPAYIHCDFVLRCKGDSMIGARIYDGDLVCIRQQQTVENGEIAAVLVDNEATLKRVYLRDGTLTLMPENPIYEPLIFIGDQIHAVHIIGKATHFISAVR